MATQFILLNVITRTVLGEQYRSFSSSLCSFLHSPVTSSLLGPNILPQHPILKHPQPPFLPNSERPLSLHLNLFFHCLREIMIYSLLRLFHPTWIFGNRGGTVIKVLCYKSEGHWFNPSWCHWNFSLT